MAAALAPSPALSSSFTSASPLPVLPSSRSALRVRLPPRCAHLSQKAEPTADRHVASSRRSLCLLAAAVAATWAPRSWALLEADEDEELLEKVKRDRKSKLQKRESLGEYKAEAATVQKAVYKLGFAGQAIDESDFAKATVVLGPALDQGWAKEVAEALAKVSSTSDEKSAASSFTSSLGSLQAAVLKDDVDGAKGAYVEAVSTLEKWVALVGLLAEIQGL